MKYDEIFETVTSVTSVKMTNIFVGYGIHFLTADLLNSGGDQPSRTFP